MYLDTNGNTYDTAQEALDAFLSDLPDMTEEQQETVFQFTHWQATPEFNLKAIQQGITYAALDTTVFDGYPVPALVEGELILRPNGHAYATVLNGKYTQLPASSAHDLNAWRKLGESIGASESDIIAGKF